MEKYYKVAESVLTEIAHAIRLQKKTDKKYLLDNMAKIIKAMLVLPSGLAEVTTTLPIVTADVEYSFPIIYRSSASDSVPIQTVITNLEYSVPIVYYGRASVNAPMPMVEANAIGLLEE